MKIIDQVQKLHLIYLLSSLGSSSEGWPGAQVQGSPEAAAGNTSDHYSCEGEGGTGARGEVVEGGGGEDAEAA